MKRLRCAELLESRELLTLAAEMVADLTTTNPKSSDIREVTEFREHIYFLADDGANGQALWRTDGTLTGTEIFRDFREPGFAADVGELTVVGDMLFFHAFAGANVSTELWKTDGTFAGTNLVKDIFPGVYSSRPYLLTEAGGLLYFFCRHFDKDQVELWKSDGTEEGTQQVHSFDNIAFGFGREPSELRYVNGRVFFEIDNGIWMTDGTNAGTVMLKDFSDLPYFNDPLRHVSFGDLDGRLYFFAKDEEHGRELWTSDGTAESTVLVRDLNAAVYDSIPLGVPLVTTPNRLFFQAARPDGSFSLWSSDGTFKGTSPIEGIPTGGFLFPAPFGDRVLIHAGSSSEGLQRPWVSDGTAEGTYQLADILSSGHFQVDGGVARFMVSNEGNPELWRTDGTVAGTFFESSAARWTEAPRPIGNGLFFGVARDDLTGFEPWSWDGTPDGAQLIRDIHPGNDRSSLQLLGNVGDELLFSRTDPVAGAQLWVTDDSPLGVSLLPAPPFGNSPARHVSTGNLTYFVAKAAGDSVFGLWRTDGTAGGTIHITDIPSPGSDFNYELEAAPGGLFFTTSAQFGKELYFTDGTSAGTRLVKDIGTRGETNPSSLTMVGDQLYFVANDGVNGYEIWTSDGTEAGTRLVKAIQQPNGFESNRFRNLTAFQGILYFSADDVLLNNQLWRSDGTDAGTYMVAQLTPRPSDAGLGNFQVLGNQLLFTAFVAPYGQELWTTDGTADGTKILKDITPGPAYGDKFFFGVVNGRMLFYVRTQVSPGQFENVLWRTDGTEDGTVPYFNLAVAGDASFQNPIARSNSQLFFVVTPNGFEYELWMTDGTTDQTRRALTFRSNGFSSALASPIVIGDRVYFIGDDGFFGHELWRTVNTPGDTNFDGVVDLVDLNNVRNHFGYEGDDYPGDVTGDGVVGLDDLNAVRNNFGATGSSVMNATPWHRVARDSTNRKPSNRSIAPDGLDALMHLIVTEPPRPNFARKAVRVKTA